MNLMDTAQLLGNFGEFVGAFAVVATLIYLAVQIRQNSTQIRLNSVQTATERYAGLITTVLQDPVKFEMFRDGLNSYSALKPEQQAQFHSHLVNVATAYNNSLELLQAGVISEETLMAQKRDVARILKCPGALEWRESIVFESDMQAQMDAVLDDIIADSEAIPLNQLIPFLHKRTDVR